MKINIISYTKKGQNFGKKLRDILNDDEIRLYHKYKHDAIIEKQFKKGNAIVFIGACGIAVRKIAPFIQDKMSDSPVIVIDEKGNYVIPILSGHMGGANELANKIAEKIDAKAVITTATDINNKFAVDMFAKHNNLHIENKEAIAKISAKVLNGKKIKIAVSDNIVIPENTCIPDDVEIIPFLSGQKSDVVISDKKETDSTLYLKPKAYVIGIGCKAGMKYKNISDFIDRQLKELKINKTDICTIASIDIKQDEKGICKWAEKNRIPFAVFSKEELLSLEGSFSSSDFVKKTVGVDNVCERAAMLCCGGNGKLIMNKTSCNGITIAVAKKKQIKISFDNSQKK